MKPNSVSTWISFVWDLVFFFDSVVQFMQHSRIKACNLIHQKTCSTDHKLILLFHSKSTKYRHETAPVLIKPHSGPHWLFIHFKPLPMNIVNWPTSCLLHEPHNNFTQQQRKLNFNSTFFRCYIFDAVLWN